MVEDSVSAPGSGAIDSVDQGSVPTEVTFEATYSSLASGSPLDQLLEVLTFLDLPPLGVWFAFGRYRHLAHPELG